MDLVLAAGGDAYLPHACGTTVKAREVLRGKEAGDGITLPNGPGLLIAGKPSAFPQEDMIYSVGVDGACLAPAQQPAGKSGLFGSRSNGRFVMDSAGRFYQLHSLQGLIRISDGVPVVKPNSYTLPSVGDVYVGIDYGSGSIVGLSILDAAFDPDDDSVVYVTPVLVKTDDGFFYKASAKLTLPSPPDGTFTVSETYGLDPHDYSSVAPSTGDGDVVYEPSLQGMRELEIDDYGNLFIVAAHASGGINDWISVYDSTSGISPVQPLNISDTLHAPTALLVSEDGDHLYLAGSTTNGLQGGQTRIHRFDIHRSLDRVVTSITSNGYWEIENVTSNGQLCNGQPCGHIGAIASITEEPASGDLYIVSFSTPRYADNVSVPMGPILAVPTLVVIPDPATASGTFQAMEIDCDSLSLPLAAAFIPGPAPGDCDGDGDVDMDDYDRLQDCFTGPSGSMRGDYNADGVRDLSDFHLWQPCLAGPEVGIQQGCRDMDFDYDSDVDLRDFALLQYLLARDQADCEAADLDSDLDVDLQDFAVFQQAYMGG